MEEELSELEAEVEAELSCSDGSKPMNCSNVSDPCVGAVCPLYRNAVCMANPCDNCQREWTVNGRDTTYLCKSKRKNL